MSDAETGAAAAMSLPVPRRGQTPGEWAHPWALARNQCTLQTAVIGARLFDWPTRSVIHRPIRLDYVLTLARPAQAAGVARTAAVFATLRLRVG